MDRVLFFLFSHPRLSIPSVQSVFHCFFPRIPPPQSRISVEPIIPDYSEDFLINRLVKNRRIPFFIPKEVHYWA
jgi:hypothetical protein